MSKRQERRHHVRIDHPAGEQPIRFELFSTERLEQHATSLAQAQKVSSSKKGRKLIHRLQDNSVVLLEAYKAIIKEVHEKRAITASAEWLLDNFHIIEEQINGIRVNLPESYYRELPKLSEGVLEGYSMRAIAKFEWTEFVEDVSLVDECLRTHENYIKMDFLTRDRYRHGIEELAKRSPHTELEITHKVIDKVQSISDDFSEPQRQQDPGYYLIGSGRHAFEQEVNFRPSLKQKLLRFYIAKSGFAYISTLIILTILLLTLPLTTSLSTGLRGWLLFVIILLSLFPASDIVVGLINRLIIAGLPPLHLPRLELKDGIPETLKTFVVVPTMFLTERGVKDQIKQLEIRYLSNPGAHVYFALLSDWSDADQETMPQDQHLLNVANNGIIALNDKYGEEQFFCISSSTFVESQ